MSVVLLVYLVSALISSTLSCLDNKRVGRNIFSIEVALSIIPILNTLLATFLLGFFIFTQDAREFLRNFIFRY